MEILDIIDGAGCLDLGPFDFTDVLGAATGILRAFSAFDRLVSLSPGNRSSKDERQLPADVSTRREGQNRIHKLSGIYAVLDTSSFNTLSDEAKIAAGGVSRTLTMSSGTRSWMEVLNTLMTCPLIAPCPECDVTRAHVLKIQQPNWVQAGGNNDAVIEEVRTWLADLLKPETLSLSKPDIASIVDYARAAVSRFALHKGERKYRKLIDLGVLCYPDAAPGPASFKFYRIELYAWAQRPINEANGHTEGGIEGNFNARIFEPRAAVIGSISDASRQKAIAGAKVLFTPSAE